MAFNIGFYAYAIIGHTRADQLLPQLLMEHIFILCLYNVDTLNICMIPPANFVCGGYTVFTLSMRVCVHPCVCPSVTFCFFNILKSHCWIFIKPCKHVHICKTNTVDIKVRARGQFY